MKLAALLLFAPLLLASPAASQQVVFHDGFENGLSNWTTTGLWHLEPSTDPCAAQATPYVEGTNAAWFGVAGQCNYDTPPFAPSGQLAMSAFVTLPNSPSISLRFWSWSQTEYCWGGWDVHSVSIEAQNGPNPGSTQMLCDFNGPIDLLVPWHERRIDLSNYRGANVRIGFYFATNDNSLNQWLGWLIDDVSIIAEPAERMCGSAGLNSGCPCMSAFVPVAGGCRNSTEQSATLLSDGVPSIAQDTLVFTAAHMPPGTTPTLFQGTTVVTPAAFGDGLRCLGGSQRRLGTQPAPTGSTSWPAQGAPSLSVHGQVVMGETRYYQVIYRNAISYCTPATFNLTDAERVVWSP